MDSKRNRQHRKGGRKAGANKNRELEQEIADPGGALNTHPYPKRTLVNDREVWYAVPGRLDPFPPRYRTTMTVAIRGNIPSGTGPLTYYAKLNSPLTSFNGGTWAGALPSITTLNATGFSSICNLNLYQNYRVFGSRIIFEMAPVADIDIMQVTLTPSAVFVSPASTAVALAQPYTKSMMVQRGQPRKDCMLINKMSCATLIGVTESAILNDLSGQTYATFNTNPNDLQYWVLNFVREDGSTTNSAIGYKCTIQYDVEFFADASGINVETIAAQAVAKTPLPQHTIDQSRAGATEQLQQQLSHLLSSDPMVKAATQDCPLKGPWQDVAPSKFLDAYLAAREAQKKNP